MSSKKHAHKIRQWGGFIYTIACVLLIVVPLLARKQIIVLPSWYNVKVTGIIILIGVILYAVYLLWAEDFFKKKWSKKNYMPVFAIIIAIVVGMTLVIK